MSWKCFKLMLLVVVFSVGVAFATPPAHDNDAWFGNGAGDGGLWTTNENWWRGFPPVPADVNGAGHDAANATLRVNSGMGQIDAAGLYVGVWGGGADGPAYFSMDSGLLVLEDEFMIGYRAWDGGSWVDGEGVTHYWSNWGNGSATITGGQILIGAYQSGIGTLGIGSTAFKDGVGGVGELHIAGGIIGAEVLVFGVIDPCIPGTALSVDITDGKLILYDPDEEIDSLDPRVTAFGGVGILHFSPGMDWSDYTTVWAEIPEPATIAMLGLGGLALLRRKRA